MKNYTLDAEEQDILDRFENDEFAPLDVDKEKFIAAARETLRRHQK